MLIPPLHSAIINFQATANFMRQLKKLLDCEGFLRYSLQLRKKKVTIVMWRRYIALGRIWDMLLIIDSTLNYGWTGCGRFYNANCTAKWLVGFVYTLLKTD